MDANCGCLRVRSLGAGKSKVVCFLVFLNPVSSLFHLEFYTKFSYYLFKTSALNTHSLIFNCQTE